MELMEWVIVVIVQPELMDSIALLVTVLMVYVRKGPKVMEVVYPVILDTMG